MDFIYEQEVEPRDKDGEKDSKTEEQFHKLEDSLLNTYTQFESKATTFTSKIGSFIKNYPKDELLKGLQTKTNNYLNDLDKELESIENLATNYASKLMIGIKGDDDKDKDENEDDLIDDEESGLLFNVSTDKSTNVKTTNDRSKDIYLNFKPNDSYKEFIKTFNVESKKNEIDQLLKDESILRLSEVINNGVSYEQFWSIYFFEKYEESKGEIPSWDDDDDDDDDEDDNVVVVDVDGDGDKPLNDKPESKRHKAEKPQEAEEEDSDDDWE